MGRAFFCGIDERFAMTKTVDVKGFTPNCTDCHALCCVALALEWPHYKKPAGEPCKNLDENFRCSKWNSLEAGGYRECRSFSCFGAGQAVAQFTEANCLPNWRESAPEEHAELSIFQRVYSELYNDFLGVLPPRKEQK
ncbi:MAG: hypothetical protein H8E30_00550 [Alphaproteobacteria bacterium]|nr:hypothetical protein [Alphaproteobacteria bacterium]